MEIEHPTAQDLENNVRTVLTYFDDPTREGLIDTPRRVVSMWHELLKAEEPKITVFDSKGYDQMIIDKDIPFFSLCEHHLIPFLGIVTIGYIPNKKLIGLSKLSRIVDYFSRRLNTQEYLTQNIANYIQKVLEPLGCGVTIKARHLCREMRGARSRGEMVTSALKGVFFNQKVREEFLGL